VGDWHVIAGEYPPTFGGVAAYTAHVAAGLADAGEATHVWTLGTPQQDDDRPGLRVHRVGGSWSRSAFGRVSEGIAALPGNGPRRLLVQYTPNSFGAKGMNLRLCRWLDRRSRRGDDVRVTFHELWYFPVAGDRIARRVLSGVQRLMVRSLLNSCSSVYVTIPHWAELLKRYPAARRLPVVWLPVPSNIPVLDDPVAVAEVRRRVAGESPAVVGHFGTYSGRIEELLADAFPRVLEACPGAVGLLIGPGGEAFAGRAVEAHPGLRGRLVATGALSLAAVSHHLRACDLLVQPYPDGVTSRRTTVMAALEHGVPVVTTRGAMTEPVWHESQGVATAPEGDAEALACLAAGLLADPARRARLGELGRQTYLRHFALERVVETLLHVPGSGADSGLTEQARARAAEATR
jgi:glycosyltransferase involved in cell wall biosynthesis